MKSIRSIFVALAVLFLLNVSAIAQEAGLFALATPLPALNDRATEGEIVQTMLYSINPLTGVPTEIGPTGFTLCSGLDFEPITNELFAVCSRLEPIDIQPKLKGEPEEVGAVLVNIDRLTGLGIEIGPLNIPENKATRVSDISFRSDGTLFVHVSGAVFGIMQAGRVSPGADENFLGIIDTTTGKLAIVGPTGSEDSFGAIGFSLKDDLYHSTDNFEIPGGINMLNQMTGNAAQLNALIYPAQFSGDNIISSMDSEPVTGDLFAMLFSEERNSEESFSNEAVEIRNETTEGFFLIKINPASGGIETIGQTSGSDLQFAAIALLNEQTVEVPTLSEYGLILTVVMLLGVAVVFLRRRQTTSGI